MCYISSLLFNKNETNIGGSRRNSTQQSSLLLPQPDRAGAGPSRSPSRRERAARERAAAGARPRGRARRTWAAHGSAALPGAPLPASHGSERAPEPRGSERTPGAAGSSALSLRRPRHSAAAMEAIPARRPVARCGWKLNPAPCAPAAPSDRERHRQSGTGRAAGAGADFGQPLQCRGRGRAGRGELPAAGGAGAGRDTYLCSAHHDPCHAAGWPRRRFRGLGAGPLPGRVSWRGRKRRRAGGGGSAGFPPPPAAGLRAQPRPRAAAGAWRGPSSACPGHGHPCPAAAPGPAATSYLECESKHSECCASRNRFCWKKPLRPS